MGLKEMALLNAVITQIFPRTNISIFLTFVSIRYPVLDLVIIFPNAFLMYTRTNH